MICAACGADNREGRQFCRRCGARLALLCARCGAPNDAGDSFCGACGMGLDASQPPDDVAATWGGAQRAPVAQRAEPVAERRHVSVLFADLVGFTALSQARDAEEVRELLTTYFATARTVIRRYGGTVEKFIGDAVMAVWGVPASQEDDAERAVRAGLELVDAVSAFGQKVGAPDLLARAGITSGEAAVTLGATGEGMVAGDLVNTASRIQSVAEPGAVFVSEATQHATRAAIVYEDTGRHELKGKPEPLQLWRAQRVVAGRGGAMRVSGLEPPFVGRERELRLLKELLHATSEEAHARLLSVVGVAGVGKSRLAWELEKYIDGVAEGIWWHRGRCLAYGEGVTYWALAEMVRMRAGIVEAEASEPAREKLRASVAQFITDEEDRRWVEPRLAQLLGLAEGEAGDPRDLFAAWRFFFERLSERQLTVLVFEDLQWADSALLDFIEYLLEWSREYPIFVLTLARPDIADRRPGWASGKRGVSSLYLDPLSEASMAQLLDGMVPGLSEDLRGRILGRAAGVPLYAVETVRMLLDRGLLIEEDGVFRTSGELEDLDVPESLHALIAARLDSLAPAERRLLQDAAVLGKSFSVAALSAVSERSPAECEPQLSALVRKELLATQIDPRSPERGQYVFVQDMVQRIAYETMARRERKVRHLAAAGYLASAWSGEDEVAEVVAAHLVEAYQADPASDDADAIKQRALSALVRAGEHAASLAAVASAQRYFEQALEFSEDDATRADMHGLAGDMAKRGGRHAEARSHFVRAIALHDAGGNTGAAARMGARLAELDFFDDKVGVAIERMERAMSVLSAETMSSDEQRADVALLAAQLGRMHFLNGDAEQSMARTELALGVAESLGLTDAFLMALTTKGTILYEMQGRPKEGALFLEHALSISVAENRHEIAQRAYHNLAQLRLAQDRCAEALSLLDEARALAKRTGDRARAITFVEGSVEALVALGRWDDAFAIAPDPDVIDVDVTFWVAIALLQLVWPRLWRGEIDKAQHLIAVSAPLLEESPDPINQAELLTARAALQRAQGAPDDALALAERAIEVSAGSFRISTAFALMEAVEAALDAGALERVDGLVATAATLFPRGHKPSFGAHVLRWGARIAARKGEDDAEIAPRLRGAAAIFADLQMPFWLAVTRLELGEWLASQGRLGDAAELLATARSTFEQLAATPWIRRTEAALLAGAPAPAISRPA